MEMWVKINLGCGANIMKGWINLDCAALAGVDVVHDLNVLPLPFEDECADEILCEDVLEHVESNNYVYRKFLDHLDAVGHKRAANLRGSQCIGEAED